MRQDLINLTPKRSYWFIFILSSSWIISCSLIKNAAIILYYKLLLLGSISLIILNLGYKLIFYNYKQIDILLTLNLVILWESPSRPTKLTITAIKALSNLAIIICCKAQGKSNYIFLAKDSIAPQQFKHLMRCSRWK
jgi:hypothetical protein